MSNATKVFDPAIPVFKDRDVDTWWCDLWKARSDVGIRFPVYYDGNKESFDKVIDEKVSDRELAENLKRRSLSDHELPLRDARGAVVKEITRSNPVTSRSYSAYTLFFSRDSAEGQGRFRERFAGKQALFRVIWIHAGGNASEKKLSDSAFPQCDCT
ncbi:hypothetical protein VUR80DRAFT_7580 [Thermomyces stellatus]